MTSMAEARGSEATYPDLAGRRVLVTGGAAGLGLGIAEAFVRQGSRIVLYDLDEEALERSVAHLRELGGDAMGVAGSVVDERAVGALFERIDAALEGLDILVNNAGIAMNKPTLELTLGEWQQSLDINLTGVFLCSQAAGRRMIRDGRGVILNLASMYGIVAAPERVAYCATKSAVAMMTKSLAVEWAEHGLRVNALAPGYVRTALVERLVQAERIDEAKLIQRTPMKRLGLVEEIADLAVFLASDSARFITGQAVGIDGGWSAYGYI